MKFATALNLSALFAGASAFVPGSMKSASTTLRATEGETESTPDPAPAPSPAVKTSKKRSARSEYGIGPAASFTAATKADLVDIAVSQNPAIKYFDPLNLAEAEFWQQNEEATIGFLRQAEIKHGRVAMAAFVGYCVQSNVQWPFPMRLDGTPFPSGDLSPEAQWDAIPENAKWQILSFVGVLEILDECYCGDLEARPHYMRGGQPGKYPAFSALPLNLYDPFGLFGKMSEKDKARRLNMEINNGRLAMIGIFGFLSADAVPGSVPFLDNLAQPYDGNVMVPFEGQFSLFGN